MLDSFELLNVSGSVGVPGCSFLLNHRSDERSVAMGLDLARASLDIAPQESKGVVCLFCGLVHVLVPGQVVSQCNSKVLSLFHHF